MNAFKVIFPSHYAVGHRQEYLNELSDFADWREVDSGVYLVVPVRKNAVHLVRADLRRQSDLRRLTFVEVEA